MTRDNILMLQLCIRKIYIFFIFFHFSIPYTGLQIKIVRIAHLNSEFEHMIDASVISDENSLRSKIHVSWNGSRSAIYVSIQDLVIF